MKSYLITTLSFLSLVAGTVLLSQHAHSQYLDPNFGKMAVVTAITNGLPTLVNEALFIQGSAGTTVSGSYTPVTGNSVIGVCQGMSFNSNVPSAGTLSDGGANTYGQDDSYASTADLGSGGRYPFWYVHRAANVTGGTYTYTCSVTAVGGATYTFALHILEYKGIANSSAVDGTPVHITGSTAAWNTDSGAMTRTNATDLILGIYVLPASGANGLCTPFGGASMVSSYQDTTIVPGGIFSIMVPTTDSRHVRCGFASTNKYIIGQIAYKAA